VIAKAARGRLRKLRRIGDPSLVPTIASKDADGSPFYGVEHSADKTSGGVAARASTPLSSFLRNGFVGIHPATPEPTLRDSCLRLPTCWNPAAIRCLPGAYPGPNFAEAKVV
jgi:hypothetical protein